MYYVSLRHTVRRKRVKYYLPFYSDIMYLDSINLKRIKEKFLFFVFFDFSTKRAGKLKETGLLNKLITGGPSFSSHPVGSFN